MPTCSCARAFSAPCFAFLPLVVALAVSPIVAAEPLDTPDSPPLDGSQWLPDRRDESQRDRLQAAALAAHGRLLFQRREFAQALRRYQRAWRYAPELVRVFDEIVPLAFGLNRGAEATRYAVLAADTEVRDPKLLVQLGDFLLTTGDVERAGQLYGLAVRGDLPPATAWSTKLKLGRLHFRAERYAQAAALFDSIADAVQNPKAHGLSAEQAKQLLASPESTYLVFAEAFLETDQPDRAAAMFRRAAEAAGEPALLEWHLARIAARGKDWPAVRRHLDAYLKDPWPTGDDQPWKLLGRLLRHEMADQGDEAARAALLEQLAGQFDQTPDNQALARFLARQYEAAGQSEAARQVLERAVARQQADGQQAEELLGDLAEHHLRRKQWLPFVQAAAQLMLREGSLRSIGDALDALTRSEESLDALLRAARRSASGAGLPAGGGLALGQIAVVGGRFDEAAEFYRRALADGKPGTEEVYFAWGLSLLLADQYGRAADVFAQALERNGLAKSADRLYFYRAGCLALDGRTEAALRDARRAAALRPGSAEYHARIAWIHYQAGQDAEARKAYQDLLTRFERDVAEPTRVVLREARRILSNLASREKKRDQAEEWLEQVLDEFPEDVGALNDLGYLWAEGGVHLERALRMTRAAVRAEPDNLAYRDSLGWVYHRLGRHQEALRQLNQAAEPPETDGVILDHLGDVYWALDRRDEARDAWRRAVQAFERDEEQGLLRTTTEKLQRPAP